MYFDKGRYPSPKERQRRNKERGKKLRKIISLGEVEIRRRLTVPNLSIGYYESLWKALKAISKRQRNYHLQKTDNRVR